MEKIKKSLLTPNMLKSQSLFWEILDARSPCQAFKSVMLRHLLKTDVALYDIGTRLPGKHQMHSLARYRTQRIGGHHLLPAASFCTTQPVALWGLFKFYQSFWPTPDTREHYVGGVGGNEPLFILWFENV